MNPLILCSSCVQKLRLLHHVKNQNRETNIDGNKRNKNCFRAEGLYGNVYRQTFFNEEIL
jgi:hypothetical protein